MNQVKVLSVALNEYGVTEQPGIGSNPEVLKYYQKIGQNWVKEDSDVAWCAAFVGFCLESALLSSTKALNARSYLNWGTDTKYPMLGDVVVLWRDNPNSSLGHVGFFIRQDKNYVWLLAGNQSDAVNIARYPLTQVLSYRTY